MKYCFFNYVVYYNNGKTKSGSLPFYGDTISKQKLTELVKRYAAGLPDTYSKIDVDIIKEYPNEKDWISSVKDSEGFISLQRIMNYGGEAMKKYFPDELRKRFEE